MSGAITPAQLVDIVNDMMEPSLPQPVKEGRQPVRTGASLLCCFCAVIFSTLYYFILVVAESYFPQRIPSVDCDHLRLRDLNRWIECCDLYASAVWLMVGSRRRF